MTYAALSTWGYQTGQTSSATGTSQRERERRIRLTQLRGGQQRAKTHCPHGHPYSPENTYFTSLGARACRTCHREQGRRNYRTIRQRLSRDTQP